MREEKRKMKGNQKNTNGPSTARQIAAFGKDLGLDIGGELVDLGVATLAGVGTFGYYIAQPGTFNPRRNKCSVSASPRKRRR